MKGPVFILEKISEVTDHAKRFYYQALEETPAINSGIPGEPATAGGIVIGIVGKQWLQMQINHMGGDRYHIWVSARTSTGMPFTRLSIPATADDLASQIDRAARIAVTNT